MIERFQSNRKGALGALMDLYEEEAAFFLQTINNQVTDQLWSHVMDETTKDPDCKSIQTVCEHMVGAADYYVNLVKKAEGAEVPKPSPIKLPNKSDFQPAFLNSLNGQKEYLEGRWEMSDEDIEKIVIKTGWGNVLDPESLLEHAVLHVMRHHRQVLRWLKETKN